MSYVLALDVSMGTSYGVLYQGETCLREGTIAHTQTGFGRLLAEIQSLPEQPAIVFEATGIYSRPVETFFQKNQLAYTLLNPLQAKKQLEEGSLRSWKTDKQDAHQLAQTHARNKRVPKVSQTEAYQVLRDLSRFYQEVEDDIKRTRMALHNCLQLTFPELERFFKSRVTPYGLTLICLFPHPDLVLQSSPTKIKNLLLKTTRKRISENRARQKAEELIGFAQEAYPAVEADSVHCQKAVYYAEKLQDLLQQKESLREQLIERASELEELALYASIPGIGELTAALLIGELGDIRRFDTPINASLRMYKNGCLRMYKAEAE